MADLSWVHDDVDGCRLGESLTWRVHSVTGGARELDQKLNGSTLGFGLWCRFALCFVLPFFVPRYSFHSHSFIFSYLSPGGPLGTVTLTRAYLEIVNPAELLFRDVVPEVTMASWPQGETKS